jgi:hypothetical protein
MAPLNGFRHDVDVKPKGNDGDMEVFSDGA